MPELGIAGGFDFFLKDNAGLGHEALIAARNQFLGMAAQSKLLANVRPNGQDDTPQFHIDVDTEKAGALGLSIADINNTLSTAWGGQYIDDFIDRGRVKRVLRAGRRAVPHVARGLQALVGAQRQGRDGAVLGLRELALGLRLAAPRALQRRVRDRNPGRGRRRA